MRFSRIAAWMLALGAAAAGRADVPELAGLTPDAKEYELISRLDPREWKDSGCRVDLGDRISGELTRVGYLLKLTDKDGNVSWVFASMDPFAKEAGRVGVPVERFQTYVENLSVASNVPGVKTGDFARGNIEFWPTNYGGTNSMNIPGANDSFDFGDKPGDDGGYGSMQVHNFQEKQTVFAFNNFRAGENCDLGIGNWSQEQYPASKGNPDWTFTNSGKSYKAAELFVVGKFKDYKLNAAPVALDPAKFSLTGATDREQALYRAGEPITFRLDARYADELPPGDWYIKWNRTGDDGKTAGGTERVSDQPLTITTSLDKPGFVRIQATLLDRNNRPIYRANAKGKRETVFFDGGAGVEIEKLQGLPEPEDFDAFWSRQKEKLAKVPLKATMDKVKSSNGVDVYAVTVDCAGPAPVTGYLTMPADAKEKSLPAQVNFHGYGTSVQNPPGGGSADKISFSVNAHGYLLGKDKAYYDDFFASIKSNGEIYAFDPKQNADPEQAYFNGMALRVMRALEFVKSLPQWNGRDLVVSGGSQGGLQTVWAAGLDHDVTRALPSIPWCSDLGGFRQGRLKGWYPAHCAGLDYYDTINHAKRIKCPVEITRAGLGDYTCPPSGVAILYNNIKSPKKINWVQGSTHGYTPSKGQRFTLESK